MPVYGTPLTMGLVQSKLLEAGYNKKEMELKEVKAGESIRIGAYTVEFIRVGHSIPDAVALGSIPMWEQLFIPETLNLIAHLWTASGPIFIALPN